MQLVSAHSEWPLKVIRATAKHIGLMSNSFAIQYSPVILFLIFLTTKPSFESLKCKKATKKKQEKLNKKKQR